MAGECYDIEPPHFVYNSACRYGDFAEVFFATPPSILFMFPQIFWHEILSPYAGLLPPL